MIVTVNQDLNTIVAGGIEIIGLKASAITRRKPAGEPVLEYYNFVADRDRREVALDEAVRLMTHVAIENMQGVKVKTIEFVPTKQPVDVEKCISPKVVQILGDIPLMQAAVHFVADNFKDSSAENLPVLKCSEVNAETDALIGIGQELLSDGNQEDLHKLLKGLKTNGFVISRECLKTKNLDQIASDSGLKVVMEKQVGSDVFVLLRKKAKPVETTVVKVNNLAFEWVEEMKKVLKAESEKKKAGKSRILFVDKGAESGLVGLVNCLRREPGGEFVRGILVQDDKAPEFSLQNSFYADRVDLDLAMSVLRPGKVWGSYR